MISGEAAACGGGAATCADTCPPSAARLAETNSTETRAKANASPRAASWSDELFRASCINPIVPYANVMRPLRAMIGVTCKNGGRAVNLFKKHHAHYLVRPCRRTERHPHLCHAPQFGRKSVRAAD